MQPAIIFFASVKEKLDFKYLTERASKMRKSIKSLLIVLVVAVLAATIFITTTAFSTTGINVLGTAVTSNNSSNTSVTLKAAEINDY